MKYIRSQAPGAIKLHFHIRDRFGHDIVRSTDYDPETGIGHRYVPDSEGNPTDTLIEYFEAKGYVEISGYVNPSQTQLDAIYDFIQVGFMKNRDAVQDSLKKISQEERLKQG